MIVEIDVCIKEKRDEEIPLMNQQEESVAEVFHLQSAMVYGCQLTMREKCQSR